MDIAQYYRCELDKHAIVVAATGEALTVPFERLVRLSVVALGSGNKLLFFGNGGSAADAQHLATELTVRYKKTGRHLPRLPLVRIRLR